MGYAHENWSARKWRRVLFSNESTFTQFQQGHQEKIWREPGEELNPNFTGQIYAITIKDYVVPTLQRHFSQGNGIFQEDNALSHRLKVTTAARENARIVVFDWPAQSPDFNPIENLWTEMKMMVHRHTPPLSNIKVLEKYVKDV
ncbi:unnamed protein product [Rhizophagus irregularis]|nr:unnamed protein product [Rhizophagus irregularis]